jgi:hypothetical protein
MENTDRLRHIDTTADAVSMHDQSRTPKKPSWRSLYFRQVPYREAAAIMNCSAGTAAKQYKQLAESLDESWSPRYGRVPAYDSSVA